jgi:hypothetical protein
MPLISWLDEAQRQLTFSLRTSKLSSANASIPARRVVFINIMRQRLPAGVAVVYCFQSLYIKFGVPMLCNDAIDVMTAGSGMSNAT